MTRRICVVSGSRADFGFLITPMRLIAADPALQLQTVVTGSHLCPSFGNTYTSIEDAGFAIDARVDMLLAGDGPAAVTKSIGVAMMGFADVFARLQPDIVMLLGDRYETLAAATACLIARIPVAHLAGGDTTEGAFDEQIRHAITKLSHLHFVTHEAAARRVVQMGERPEHVFNVGSSGLDYLRQQPLLAPAEVFARLGLAPRRRNVVLTFHPVTLGTESSQSQLETVLGGIDRLGEDVGVVVLGANADTEGASLNLVLRRFAQEREHVVFHPSLPPELYLSLLAAVDAVVGNSSSGLYEAPSLGTPTVNIGARQAGRLRARSVLDCPVEARAVRQAVLRAFAVDMRGVVNPYGDGQASPRIVAELKAIEDPTSLLVKRFCALGELAHVVAA